MNYEPFMKVGFIFQNDCQIKKIAGGVYHEFSTTDLSWVDFIQKEIMIATHSGNIRCKVQKVDLSTSIAGFLNLVLVLDSNAQTDLIHVGDEVYKLG